MENLNENIYTPKQRHGCVTTWLVLMIIANSLTAAMYLIGGDTFTQVSNGQTLQIYILALLGVANIVFSVLILNWKKIGFWGFTITSIIALMINLSLDFGIGQSLLGLSGIALLYGVLMIKSDNVRAWDNLE